MFMYVYYVTGAGMHLGGMEVEPNCLDDAE